MELIQLWGYRCLRCGHEWVPKNKEQKPRVCPKCKNPYWDRPRKGAGAADTAAFGRSPLSYDTACVAVITSNGYPGAAAVERHRALGAPLAIEVLANRLHLWRVQATTGIGDRPVVVDSRDLKELFKKHK